MGSEAILGCRIWFGKEKMEMNEFKYFVVRWQRPIFRLNLALRDGKRFNVFFSIDFGL